MPRVPVPAPSTRRDGGRTPVEHVEIKTEPEIQNPFGAAPTTEDTGEMMLQFTDDSAPDPRAHAPTTPQRTPAVPIVVAGQPTPSGPPPPKRIPRAPQRGTGTHGVPAPRREHSSQQGRRAPQPPPQPQRRAPHPHQTAGHVAARPGSAGQAPRTIPAPPPGAPQLEGFESTRLDQFNAPLRQDSATAPDASAAVVRSVNCPRCKTPTGTSTSAFCVVCGSRVPRYRKDRDAGASRKCRECGYAKNAAGSSLCRNCGHRI